MKGSTGAGSTGKGGGQPLRVQERSGSVGVGNWQSPSGTGTGNNWEDDQWSSHEWSFSQPAEETEQDKWERWESETGRPKWEEERERQRSERIREESEYLLAATSTEDLLVRVNSKLQDRVSLEEAHFAVLLAKHNFNLNHAAGWVTDAYNSLPGDRQTACRCLAHSVLRNPSSALTQALERAVRLLSPLSQLAPRGLHGWNEEEKK